MGECYSIECLENTRGRVVSVPSENQVARGAERRSTIRRSNPERRFGERRSPERATVGRRVEFVPDRRGQERRATDRRAFQPA
jgi:hypothetical protein